MIRTRYFKFFWHDYCCQSWAVMLECLFSVSSFLALFTCGFPHSELGFWSLTCGQVYIQLSWSGSTDYLIWCLMQKNYTQNSLYSQVLYVIVSVQYCLFMMNSWQRVFEDSSGLIKKNNTGVSNNRVVLNTCHLQKSKTVSTKLNFS